MKITERHIASIAIAAALIAGCAKAPQEPVVGKDVEASAGVEQRMAEFAEAVKRAQNDGAKTAPAGAKQRATPERAGAAYGLTPDQKDVSAAIARWAAAWSRKDVKGYLAAYAKNFAMPRARSRRQWEAERRARIVGKSWIEVKIEALEITVDGNTASARFRQGYRSDRYTEDSIKNLVLVKTNREWLIQREWE